MGQSPAFEVPPAMKLESKFDGILMHDVLESYGREILHSGSLANDIDVLDGICIAPKLERGLACESLGFGNPEIWPPHGRTGTVAHGRSRGFV